MVVFKLLFDWKEKYLSEGEQKHHEWNFKDLQSLLERWHGMKHMLEWALVSRYTDEDRDYMHLDLNFGDKGFINL